MVTYKQVSLCLARLNFWISVYRIAALASSACKDQTAFREESSSSSSSRESHKQAPVKVPQSALVPKGPVPSSAMQTLVLWNGWIYTVLLTRFFPLLTMAPPCEKIWFSLFRLQLLQKPLGITNPLDHGYTTYTVAWGLHVFLPTSGLVHGFSLFSHSEGRM